MDGEELLEIVCNQVDVGNVIKAGLSFVLPSDFLNNVSGKLRVMEEKMHELGQKVELMLREPKLTASQNFDDALLALKSKNYSGAVSHFKEAGKCARRAFNLMPEDVESMILCTEIQGMAAYMELSFENGEMRPLSALSSERQMEMASRIESLLQSLNKQVNRIVEAEISSVSKTRWWSKTKKRQEVLEKVEKIQKDMAPLFAKAYPVFAEAKKFTQPEAGSFDVGQLSVLNVRPDLLPKHRHARTSFSISKQPDNEVSGMYLEYSYGQDVEIEKITLHWWVNGTAQKKLVLGKSADLMKKTTLTISKQALMIPKPVPAITRTQSTPNNGGRTLPRVKINRVRPFHGLEGQIGNVKICLKERKIKIF